MVQFTDIGVKNLSAPGYHWDDRLPGFGLRIGKRTKTFICVRAGVRTTIGRYPYISLSDARKEALQHLHDPKPKSPDFSVSEAATAYLAAIDVRPNTHRFYKLYLDKLGAKYSKTDLATLTPRQCAELIDSPHMHLALKVFFNWCKGQALITVSPMENLKPIGKFKTRSRVLTDDELKRVWIASEQLGAFGCIVRLCLLTAQRRGELSQIQPEWITKSTVEFPSTVTKNHRAHILPLSLTSIEVLNSLANTSVRAWSKPKKKLDQLSGVSGWVLHDCRRTTATNLARLGTDPFLIERILNHTMPKLQGIYNRHDFTEAMREPLRKHEDWLLALVKS